MSHEELPQQFDRDGWPRMRAKFEKAISQKTRDEWAMIFEGSDSCVFPVLSFKEAQQNKHNQLREIFAPSGDIDGALEPMPAPKLLRTPGLLPRKSPEPGGAQRRNSYRFWIPQVRCCKIDQEHGCWVIKVVVSNCLPY